MTLSQAGPRPESPWIVRNDRRLALTSAEEIRDHALSEAFVLVAEATGQSETIREAARQVGFHEGAAAAALLLGETEAALVACRRASANELVPLAFAIAHRILGAFPEEERLLRAVTTALDEHRGISGLKLRADPHTAQILRKVLHQDGWSSATLVEVDDTAPPGSCVLMHPRGRAAIGPIEQLRALFATALPEPSA